MTENTAHTTMQNAVNAMSPGRAAGATVADTCQAIGAGRARSATWCVHHHRQSHQRPTSGRGVSRHVAWIVLLLAAARPAEPLTADTRAGQTIALNLESAVALAMRSSHRIRQLQLGLRRSRLYLQARQAQLRSAVSLDLVMPQYEGVSDYQWNSTLRRNEIVRQNTRQWEMGLAVAQPVILFGRPTDGYLSLKSRLYRYDQRDGASRSSSYYNRHYLELQQPLFRPNELRNDLEEAELNLEQADLEFLDDQLELIQDVADDFFDLLERSCRDSALVRQVTNLQQLLQSAHAWSRRDSLRAMEAVQVRVELESALEARRANQRDVRVQMERLQQRLSLLPSSVLVLPATMQIRTVAVDERAAVRYALALRPRLRMDEIAIRAQEIDVQNTRGQTSFHVDLALTYGLEKQSEDFAALWHRHDNSYSVSVRAAFPLWDWGHRRALIQAERLGVEEARLRRTESADEIARQVRGRITDVQEFQRRALGTQENVARASQLTRAALDQYEQGRLSLQDALRSIAMQLGTEMALVEAYLGYRRATLELAVATCYDFENHMLLLDRFVVPHELPPAASSEEG